MTHPLPGWVTRARSPFSGYDRRLWILYAGFMASSMGFAMIVPFVSLYFHEELGVSMSLVGTFFLVTALVRSLFQGYAGELSDRLGRVRLMTAGQAARGVLFAVMAVAVFRRLDFWTASGILTLSYVAGAFFQPAASAAVSDLVPRERRLDAYALMRVSHNLGWGVGPMLGGLVAGAGYGWLFVVGAATSLFSAWLVRRFVSETLAPVEAPPPAGGGIGEAARTLGKPTAGADRRPAKTRARAGWRDFLEVRHDRRFLVFCGLSLLIFITMSQWLATLSVYASDRLDVTTTRLGLMFGMNGFLVVVFQIPVARGLRWMSLVGAMILGALVYAVSFFGIAFASTYLHLVIAMAAITLGELIVSPAAVSLVSLIAPRGRTGRYMGLFGLTTAFGWSAGPFVGGILLDLWGDRPVLLWGAIAAFAAAAAVGFWRFRGLYPAGSDSSGSSASPASSSATA